MTLRMLIRSVCALVALATLAATGPVRAQQVSIAGITTANEILDARGSMNMFEPLIPGVIEQAKGVFTQSNPNLGKDLNEVALTIRKELAPRNAALKAEIAKLYASRFTEQELKEALAFYKSPLGKKLLAEETQFVERTLQFAQDWATRLSEEVMVKFRAEMKKKGHTI